MSGPAWIDAGLYSAGAVIAAVALIRTCLHRPRLDRPFWPMRPHRLKAEALALPIGVYFLAASIALIWVPKSAGPSTPASPALTATLNIGVHLISLAACLVVGHLFFEGRFKAFMLGLAWRPGLIGVALGWWLVSLACIAAALWITERGIRLVLPGFLPPEHETLQALHKTVLPMGVRAWLVTGAVLVSPLAEECFFRGLLQTYFVKLLPARGWAVALAAVLFGLVHSSQPQAVPPLIAFGLLLGTAYERTGALVVPIIIHVMFNARTILWQSLSGTG